MKDKLIPRIEIIGSMSIFATIGLLVKYTPIPPSVVAMIRGAVGMLFMVAVILIGRREISFKSIKENALKLFISGALIGINWILLFESYRYTSVATATLCYYMAPVFVILASPILLGEKLTAKKLICVAVAIVGMVFVSGIPQSEGFSFSEIRGVLLALSAAVLYSVIVLLNKKLGAVGTYEKTAIQLGSAAIATLPYTLITENFSEMIFSPFVITILLVMGIVNTGIAYALYFDSIGKLSAQTTAIFSYIDPIGAVLISAFILKEPTGLGTIVGAILILGATLASELTVKNKFRDVSKI